MTSAIMKGRHRERDWGYWDLIGFGFIVPWWGLLGPNGNLLFHGVNPAAYYLALP